MPVLFTKLLSVLKPRPLETCLKKISQDNDGNWGEGRYQERDQNEITKKERGVMFLNFFLYGQPIFSSTIPSFSCSLVYSILCYTCIFSMGNSHSNQHKKSNITRQASLESTHSASVPVSATTSTLPTPGLSRSSSKTTSRPASVIGDVKECVNKILGRSSSALDVTSTGCRSTPRRSFSAPAGCFDSTMLNSCSNMSSSTTKYCLPIDETEQDRLTNTVTIFVYTSYNHV